MMGAAGRPRTLILVGTRPAADLPRRIAGGSDPRVEYWELARRLGAEVLDFGDVDRCASRLVRLVARQLGPSWALALLGARSWDRCAHVYATGEDVGIPLAILLTLRRRFGRVTMVMHNGATARRTRIWRLLGHRVLRHAVCLCEAQRRALVSDVGIPAGKVRRLNGWIDERFFRAPSVAPGDYVLSVGMESRDYPTLQAAVAGLPYRVHVVASGWSPQAGFRTSHEIAATENLVVEHGVPFDRLRELYANCRFVVMPLKSTVYASGVTGIMEGMAMGKAIVASASPGIAEYVRDGISGRLVPVGDAAALRRAIEALWGDVPRLRRMGEHNRAWVESEMGMSRYVERIADLLGTNRDAAAPSRAAPMAPAGPGGPGDLRVATTGQESPCAST